MKVSVIIPVYNSEKYLEKCLNSLIKQTLEDIEIVCINDGSTDNSLEILNAYAKKDRRIKVLSQKNLKQGAARNNGLKIAQGEFISFVDSDDWVDFDYLEKLYNAAIDNNVNMAASSITREKKHSARTHLGLSTKAVYTGGGYSQRFKRTFGNGRQVV